MFKNLSTGAIGIRNISLEQTLQLAQQTGFAGIDFDIREAAQLAGERGIDYVRGLFDQYGIQPGGWGLPVAWNQDHWLEGVVQLPALAEVAQQIGATRTQTWCPPTSTERDFAANFEWHVERFMRIAKTLHPYGIRFGIEFIGPKTMRPPNQYDFIYTMDGMLELIAALDSDNAGLLLDAWHLYTSGGSLDDMDELTNADVVTVHVNDAPEGLTMDTYIDQDRRLPMETGVIDLPGFLQKLAAINYDGPVTAEPFSQRVNSIEDPLEAVQLTAEYMDKMWEAAGV